MLMTTKRIKKRMHARVKPARVARKIAKKAVKRNIKKITLKSTKKIKTKAVTPTKKVKTGAQEKPEKRSRKEIKNANIYAPEEVAAAIQGLAANEAAIGYLKKNVSKRAMDVVNGLVSPKTDEALAAELDMKINAVRRILNIMQGYGITNYYVAKNVNGWLSFAWYINISKLPPFFDYIESLEQAQPIINKDCNDYFVCDSCYDKTKLIFTFDAAFEENFKCGACGDGLKMLDKSQASDLMGTRQKTVDVEPEVQAVDSE